MKNSKIFITLLAIVINYDVNATEFKYCRKIVAHSTHITKLLKDKKYILAQKELLSDVIPNGENFSYTKIQNKTIYRSGYLSYSPACIRELAEHNLKLVINISYTGDVVDEQENHYNFNNILTNSEKDLFSFFGVKHYMKFDFDLQNVQSKIDISNLIRYIKMFDGDVLIHCYSGIHRTGTIFGIIQKCINNYFERKNR
jgi:protein tyrosine/serine phosphatase